jgi:hypothetical protein
MVGRDKLSHESAALMEKISLFSLEKHDGPYHSWPSVTRLYADGVNTQQKLPGFQIEAQYRCNHGYLIITNYDCPHEETDAFILLSDAYKIIAETQFSFYSPLIAHHWPVSDTAIRLHYYDHSFCTLNIETHAGSPSLNLTPFEDISKDPQATASKAALQQRLDDLTAHLAAKNH